VPTLTAWWGVFLGGCIGTALRVGIGLTHPDRAFADPASGTWAATMTVNVLGALLLGVLMARLRGRPNAPDWLAPTIALGLLGSFTTYSALAVDAAHLGRVLGPAWAIGYPLLSLLLGLAALRAGLWLGRPRRTASQDASC
jgi:fluoride exporter